MADRICTDCTFILGDECMNYTGPAYPGLTPNTFYNVSYIVNTLLTLVANPTPSNQPMIEKITHISGNITYTVASDDATLVNDTLNTASDGPQVILPDPTTSEGRVIHLVELYSPTTIPGSVTDTSPYRMTMNYPLILYKGGAGGVMTLTQAIQGFGRTSIQSDGINWLVLS